MIAEELRERGYAKVKDMDLAAARAELGVEPVPPRELFAPRRQLGDQTYSAPQWAPDREMCHHHEQSYSLRPPSLVLISCLTAPESGGEFLLADTAEVLGHIPPALLDRFAAHGWLLTRAYRPYLG